MGNIFCWCGKECHTYLQPHKLAGCYVCPVHGHIKQYEKRETKMKSFDLKTLKDINFKVDDLEMDVIDGLKSWEVTEESIKEQFRQEASKYVKDLDSHISKTYPGETHQVTEGEVATMIMKKLQVWIKHFFNIEEELKNENL